jgi:hypothetical protein
MALSSAAQGDDLGATPSMLLVVPAEEGYTASFDVALELT